MATTLSNDIFFSSIRELQNGWKAKQYSARELTEAFLQRLEKQGPTFNALAALTRKEALEQAKNADDERKRERFRGALQAVPFAAKDLLAFPGYPTTWGAKPYAQQTFDKPATVLEKLRKAGAILTAKLAMVELAGGPSYAYPGASLTGPCLNPWDKTKWAGGSSSGSGAAVAAGLTPFALGSETSGSILTPAAFCGLSGLRPTYGLVSRSGAMALSWTLDKIGPMCRTADDCGLVLQTIAGADSSDPGSAGKGFTYAPQFVRPWSELRVAFAEVDWSEWPEESARASLQEALRVVRELGVQMKPGKLPDFPYGPVLDAILCSEAGSIFEELVRSGDVKQLADEFQITRMTAAVDVPARDYLKAMRIRSLMKEAWRKFFYDEADVIVAPTRNGGAPSATEPLNRGGGGRAPSAPGFRGHIPAGNLAGLPALTVPCGLSNGLPVGISFLGKPFSENTLLAFGKAFQERTNHHKLRPPAASGSAA
jgi:aspartyl-tRNA(Asn)/glutamyl-tRNA(Gln) amidotransferase subunit A